MIINKEDTYFVVFFTSKWEELNIRRRILWNKEIAHSVNTYKHKLIYMRIQR